MEASRNLNPNRTEFQSVDDGIDTQFSPATHQSEETPAEIGRKSDSCHPELASATSSAVNEFECEINDDPKQNDPSGKTKKKKKKKKKKTNAGSSNTTSDTINETIQGDQSTELLLIQKAEVDREGSFQESTCTVSSPFQESEREDIQEGALSGKKKKKKKKKKKASETGDFDVSVLSSCDGLSSSPSNDMVPSEALSTDTAVPEAGAIKSDVTKDPRNTDETVSELTLDQQELLLTISTASGQNEIGCQDSSITPEYNNVQGDSSRKPKKKKKKKKTKEVEYNILSGSEGGVVLATGITEIERVNLLQVMPEESCAAGVMQQSQTRNDAEAITTQADTQLLCVHDVAATAGETVENIKPDEDSSSNGQSLREE